MNVEEKILYDNFVFLVKNWKKVRRNRNILENFIKWTEKQIPKLP